MDKFLAYIRGVTGVLALFASSFFGTLLFLTPVIPVAFMPRLHVAFRYYTDFFITAWITFAIAVMRIFYGVEIITHGDHLLPMDKALIIMNHRTRLDWFYFWSSVITDGCLFDLKIALKRPLARVPGAGWAQQLASFLFLNRRAEVDLPRISDYLTYLASFPKRGFKLLVFPEGTDFDKNTKQKSDDYADKNNLPRYHYVLHPRTTGTDFAFNKLKELDAVTAVYDVTIAYDGDFPSNEWALFSGNLPKRVHFFIKRYSTEPVVAVGPTKFWNDIWAKKEEFLEQFYRGERNEEIRGGRSEGAGATFMEYFAMVFWIWFIIYMTFYFVPSHWPLVLVTALGMFVWSEYTQKSIDGTIVAAGIKSI